MTTLNPGKLHSICILFIVNIFGWEILFTIPAQRSAITSPLQQFALTLYTICGECVKLTQSLVDVNEM